MTFDTHTLVTTFKRFAYKSLLESTGCLQTLNTHHLNSSAADLLQSKSKYASSWLLI